MNELGHPKDQFARPTGESRPLVSVVVLTFNSAATILDTLQSLLSQQYAPLEVLIADDASTDATASIVHSWLLENQGKFARAEWLPSGRNEGICGNIAKGYAHSRGQWLKPIAGDDLLAPHAIARFVATAAESRDDVLVSRLETFNDGFGSSLRSGTILPSPTDEALIDGAAQAFRRTLLERNAVPAPAIFLRREAYESVGGVDRRFRHLDDWPLWMKLIEAGRSFRMIKEPLIRYRVSAASISTRRMATEVNKDFLNDLAIFYRVYQRSRLPLLRRWHRSIEVFRWGLAGGALREHPRLYKGTRLLLLASPCFWSDFARARGRSS